MMNNKSSIPTNRNDKTPKAHPRQISQSSSENTAVTPVNREVQPETAMSTTVNNICTVLGGVVLGAFAVLAFTFGGDAVRSEMMTMQPLLSSVVQTLPRPKNHAKSLLPCHLPDRQHPQHRAPDLWHTP